MTNSLLLASEALLLCLYVFLSVVHHFTRRQRELDLSELFDGGRGRRLKRWLVGGTDADLKLEFGYFTVLIAIGLFANTRWRPVHYHEPQVLFGLVGAALGFHLRQWLSKWRLRNIVFAKILAKRQLLYFKGITDTTALAANLLVTVYLVFTHPGYIYCAFAGFFVQDLALESRKASRLLRRKLHIFDLDGLPVPDEKREELFDAIKHHSVRTLRALVRDAGSPRDRILLHAFALLLHDDFDGFRRLLAEEKGLVDGDPDLLFYFGKALYALGDVGAAREFLSRGCSARQSDRLCMAYYALTLISEANDEGLKQALTILSEYFDSVAGTRGDMFGLGFYALALALAAKDSAPAATRREDFEKALWCVNEALKINERLSQEFALGSLQRHYFLGNEQMLLDIYGYVLYRMGSYVVAFRVLEDSIRQDDTYPWPYFHLGLIYDRIGQHDLAAVIYYRIAAHERSDTVLRRLCVRRMRRDRLAPPTHSTP
jgi:tetratricopeptide (TPR) repeat protein